jgi:hypothetical protein
VLLAKVYNFQIAWGILDFSKIIKEKYPTPIAINAN